MWKRAIHLVQKYFLDDQLMIIVHKAKNDLNFKLTFNEPKNNPWTSPANKKLTYRMHTQTPISNANFLSTPTLTLFQLGRDNFYHRDSKSRDKA